MRIKQDFLSQRFQDLSGHGVGGGVGGAVGGRLHQLQHNGPGKLEGWQNGGNHHISGDGRCIVFCSFDCRARC